LKIGGAAVSQCLHMSRHCSRITRAYP